MLKHTVDEIELASGAKGLLIDVPDASVMVTQINFRAGDEYVADPLKWETAHIMEHMSLGANKRYKSAKLFTAEIEKNGAYTNASTGSTEMTYTTECADFEWDDDYKIRWDRVFRTVESLEKDIDTTAEIKHEEGIY
jgi:predicted Zn-dependent peptidase